MKKTKVKLSIVLEVALTDRPTRRRPTETFQTTVSERNYEALKD